MYKSNVRNGRAARPLSWLMGTVMLLGTAIVCAEAPEKPLIDLTKNPGCGVSGLSSAEKTQRNIRIAQYYYQAFVETKLTGSQKHNWDEFDCIAPNETVLLGVLSQPGAKPMPMAGRPSPAEARKLVLEGRSPGQMEMKAVKKAFPDYGALPGSYRTIAAWEDGVTFMFWFDGTGTDGKHILMWHVVSIQVNDAGRITNYETFQDTRFVDIVLSRAFGKGLGELTTPDLRKSLGSQK